ncbi:MAG TPA: glutathione S-transferase family protein [Hyphomicrobiaceae bacterium]|nr:glutathione S-transferase family protein [Hyphomicrobiaceae bacterium]
MLRLIHHPLCPHSRSIRLALGELRVKAELSEEQPWSYRPEFLAINPAGHLPVLIADEHIAIAGAYAISEYLEDTYPADPQDGRRVPLFPGDREERAETRRLVDWFHNKFDHDVTRDLTFERYYAHHSKTRRNPPDSANLRNLASNLRYHLKYVSYLTDHRRWLAGEDLSFADLAAAAHISCLDYLGEVPWDDFPVARAWYVRLKSRPSFHPLLDDRLPGRTPPAYYSDLDF